MATSREFKYLRFKKYIRIRHRRFANNRAMVAGKLDITKFKDFLKEI